VPLLAEDVDYWLRQFGGESRLQQVFEDELRRLRPPAEDAAPEPPPPEEPPPNRKDGTELDDLDNPFPAGYGEDLLDDDNPFPS
jgi:hypothetical protein